MNRLNQLSTQIKKEPKFLADPLDFLKLYNLLSHEENQFREGVKKFAQEVAAPKINHYVETATFPTELIEAVKPAKLVHQNTSYAKFGLLYLELAKVDAGLATFFILMASLVPYTIEKFGSDEQKEKYLEKIKNFDILGGWALTEKEVGSDASNIQTNVRKVQGGYILNGNKRWIGNGNKDILIVWAKNLETKQIEGFIIENQWTGVTSEVIKNKLALRIVQNCQITFKDVFIPEANKLPKVQGFQSVSQILMHSRVSIPWLAVGIQAGVYESVIKYTTQRRQFNKPIAGFQLQQERLVRILTTIQASFLLVLRVSRLADEGQTTPGMIASCKAWVTERTREVARLGREMMGGDGIISDNYCIKALTDAEVLYTYEGSYDINVLIAGREVTGLSAFK